MAATSIPAPAASGAAAPPAPSNSANISLAAPQLFWTSLKLLGRNLPGLVKTFGWGLVYVFGSFMAAGLAVALAFGATALYKPLGFVAFPVALAAAVVLIGWAFGYSSALSMQIYLANVRDQSFDIDAARKVAKSKAKPMAIAMFCGGLRAFGGFLLLIIPGIIWGAQAMLIPLVVLEEDLSGWAAVWRSRDIVRGNTVDVLGMNVLLSLASILQLVPRIGGFGYPVAWVGSYAQGNALAIIYDRFKSANAPRPKSEPWNIGLLIVWPIVTALVFAFVIPQQIEDAKNQAAQQPTNYQQDNPTFN